MSDDTTTVKITVIDVQRITAGKLFALATVEIDIDGIVLLVHGIQAVWTDEGTQIDPPRYRGPNGVWSAAVTLPHEVKKPIGKAVIERGIAITRSSRR